MAPSSSLLAFQKFIAEKRREMSVMLEQDSSSTNSDKQLKRSASTTTIRSSTSRNKSARVEDSRYEVKSSSASTYGADASDSHLQCSVETIPGARDNDVGFTWGDGIVYTADASRLREASSIFHDELVGDFQDRSGPTKLRDIRRCFTSLEHDKRTVSAIAKGKLFDPTGVAQSEVGTPATSSSNTITIKQEDDDPRVTEGDHRVVSTISQDRIAANKAAHLALLTLMHGRDPSLGTDCTSAIKIVQRVINLARHYDCTSILRPRLAAHLHQFRQDLFIAILNDPPKFIMIASTLQDSSMITEALIHVIGCHPSWPDSWTSKSRVERHPACGGVLVAVERKAQELQRKTRELDRELLLSTMAVDNNVEVDFYHSTTTWLILQFYRDTIATMINEIEIETADGERVPDPQELGRVYRKLSRGGDEFLPNAVVAQKLDMLMVGYDRQEVDDDLESQKKYAQGLVEEMCVNKSMLDVYQHDIGHLTCIDITWDDMPWANDT